VLEKFSILIVEDEAIIAMGIQVDLENLGYEVIAHALNGKEALELVSKCRPDLALMDINLHGRQDGIETAVQLRRLFQIPIVFLSGAIDSATVDRAKVVDPYGYIVKPFSQDNLRIALEHAFNRVKLEQAAQRSETHYRELFETTQEGILFTDLTGQIIDSNSAFSQLTGYSIAELKMLNISRLTPAEYCAEEQRIIQEVVLVRGYSDEILKEYLRKDTSRVPASLRIILRKDPAGKPIGVWAMVRNTTAEKVSAEKIRRQAEFSQKLANFTERLNAQIELPRILEIICAEIFQTIAIDSAQVTLLDPEKELLFVAHTHNQLACSALEQTRYSRAILQELLAQGVSYIVAQDGDRSGSPQPYDDMLIHQDVRSTVTVCLTRERQLIGTLGLAAIGRKHQFTEEELTYLVTYANHAAIAIDRARMYQQTRRRSDELEALARLSSVLRLANTRQEMLPTLLQEAIDFAHAGAGMLYLLDQDGCPLGSHYSSAIPGLDPDWVPPIDQTLAAPAANARVIYAVKTTQAEAAIQHILHVPFQSTHTLVAWMVLGFAAGQVPGKEDQRMLAALAEMGSNALHRSGLMEMLEQRVSDRTSELSALYDLTVFVNSPLGLAEILSEALRKILAVFQANIGLFFRYDPDASCLLLEAQVDLPAYLQTRVKRLELSSESRQWIETGRTPWLANQQDLLALPIDLRAGDNFETMLNIPVRYEGMAHGLLSVIWLDQYHPTAESIAFLTTVAERLGSTIQNDLLRRKAEHTAVIEERQRLKRELHDSVTQSVYSLTLLAEAGKDLLAVQNFSRLEWCLDELSRNSLQALKEMRMLLFELRPPQRRDQDLAQAIEDRFEAVERRAGVLATLEADPTLQLPPGSLEDLYWVTCEALNNALKHSRATAVRVRLQSGAAGFRLEIADNGGGFHLTQAHPGGIGLSTMQERVEQLGGVLDISSQPGEGTRVAVQLNPPTE
jgi:PAS domain S-box-containing protein